MRLTRALTHIRLCDANHAKIESLDALAAEYLRLCQQYTTYFCTEAQPDTYAAPHFASPLSQRWQRVAIQHAAGIAQSWRSNYAAAYQDYMDILAEYQEEPEGDLPQWKEWNTPALKEPVIQANANVALLQPAEDSRFDYWLRLSTLEKGKPIFLPLRLPRLQAGDSDRLPLSCFRLRDQRFTVRGGLHLPRAVSSGPSTGRATRSAHSGGTAAVTTAARCLVLGAPVAWFVRGARLPSELCRLACLRG